MSETYPSQSRVERKDVAQQMAVAESMARTALVNEASLGVYSGNEQERINRVTDAAQGSADHMAPFNNAGERIAVRDYEASLRKALSSRLAERAVVNEQDGSLALNEEQGVTPEVKSIVDNATDRIKELGLKNVRDADPNVRANVTPRPTQLEGADHILIQTSAGARKYGMFGDSPDSVKAKELIFAELGVSEVSIAEVDSVASGTDMGGEYQITQKVIPTEIPGVALRYETWNGTTDAGTGNFSRLSVEQSTE